MISFLKQYVGAYSRFFKPAVVFNRRRRNIDVDAPYRAVFVLQRINRFNRFEHVLYGVVYGVLAALQRKTLVSHVLKRRDLGGYFLLRQFFARDMLVFGVIRTVNAAVYAIVGQVKRREHNYSVAVKILLDFFRQPEKLLVDAAVVAGKQHGGFSVVEPFFPSCFFEDFSNQLRVVLVFVGVFQRRFHFFVADKFLRLHRFGIVHICLLCLRVGKSLPVGIIFRQFFTRLSPLQVARTRPIFFMRAASSAKPSEDSAPMFSLLS